MAIKKSELYSFLWRSCDELRGGMDASQYKDYVLTLLFMKYVSDKYAGKKGALIEVPPGGSFADMVAAKNSKEIGDRMNKIIGALAEKNGLKGVIDLADFNDEDKLGKGKEMVDRLSNLVSIFQNERLDFSKNRADGDDILGDAYEYLMRHFATESGKSKGQFYTPAEVSRIMAKVVGVRDATSPSQTIYDPTCGSGSLLLKAADETHLKITLYGQEKDIATRGLAVMNAFLHDHPTADIRQGNTITAPEFTDDDGNLKRHDYVLSNPPFSDKAWSNGLEPQNHFGRFEDGMPPGKNGDYAYLLHVLRSMKSTGKGVIVMPHGVLFRGNAEATIRRNLVRRGVIKGIIGLPANLFYGTGIPACLIVLDKAGASENRSIFMVDASKGFVKDGNKNRLRHRDIHQIVDVFTNQVEVDRYSRLVPFAEIEKNDFNLNIPRYIDSTDPEDLQDIEGHLRGGIPARDVDALREYWDVLPTLRKSLFKSAGRDGYLAPAVEESILRTTIVDHAEFHAFTATVHARFEKWRSEAAISLRGIVPGDHPKELIHGLSEALLRDFTGLPLVDRYEMYQHLMAYWNEVMQDDVYLIVADGWPEARKVREIFKQQVGKQNKLQEDPDITIGSGKSARYYKCDVIPPALIIAKFFAAEQARIDDLTAQAEDLAARMAEMIEEHGGEEGALSDVVNEKGKITKGDLNAFLKQVKGNRDYAEEAKIAHEYKVLFDQESDVSAALKEAQEALDQAVLKKYSKLTDDEAKTLTVDDKWLARVRVDLDLEIDRIAQGLTGRVRTLAQRYAEPLPTIVADVETLSARVDEHLKKMGFAV